MKQIIFICICFLSSLNASVAQENLIVNAYNRNAQSLNGDWKYIVDPYENGFYNYRYEPFDDHENTPKSAYYANAKAANKTELVEYDFDKMDTLRVPGDWNTQKERLYYYEGTVWLRRMFDYDKSSDNNRVFVYFDASNYQTDVYLNGKKLGVHIGGFTPFNFEVTDLLKEKDNFLVVKVDNKREKDAVPTLNTDWWNYGGITRDVKLIETSATFVSDYFIQLDQQDKQRIIVKASLNGEQNQNKKVQFSIPELGVNEQFHTDNNGELTAEIRADNIRYWSLNDPYLYNVVISTDTDSVRDQIGFRTIKTSGSQILLNDKPIFLKGISIHEESPINDGRAHSIEDARQLLTWAQEMGCNYVRLAHYPHNEHMVRLADQMGIMVWEENPVYWTISWNNEDTYQNAQNQLSEVMDRDKNRASVVIWSMANETPTSEARHKFLNKLAAFTKAKDPTRLISAALEQSPDENDPLVRTIHDPFGDVVDILSFNQYIGWYDGAIDKTQKISWRIEQDKPVIVSEFGAGAKYGLHGDRDTKWNEEYQEHLYQETLKMVDKIEQLQGLSPWILVDFRSPRRVLPDIQDDWNRKGVISEDGNRKKAFFVMQKYYQHRTASPKK